MAGELHTALGLVQAARERLEPLARARGHRAACGCEVCQALALVWEAEAGLLVAGGLVPEE